MSKVRNKLDRVKIPEPCQADWSQMSGNEQVRYCAECSRHVYNLSKMTRRQAEALISASQGRLCARLTRQPYDKTLTEEGPPPGLHLISRRASPLASAIVTAVMGISSSAIAHTSYMQGEQSSAHLQLSSGEKGRAQITDAPASLAGTILDSAGAVIVGAKITLTNERTGEEQTTVSSEVGEYRFLLLGPGSYTLKTEAHGFKSQVTIGVTLEGNEERRLDVTMDIGVIIQGGAIVAQPQPLRMLFNESDLVVVARVGKSVRAEREGEFLLMRTRLHITSLLKGEASDQVVHVYNWVHDGQEGLYAEGDNLLVFLNRREAEQGEQDKGGYEVDDPSYGLKKLSGSDMGVHVERIEELAGIMRQENPLPEEMVEWLVRCAEEPATRWDGAYELAASAARLLDSATEESPSEDETDVFAGFAFAALLTAEQKERLAAAMFNTETLTDRELPLIQMVKRWNDERLAPFLISQLRRLEAEPPYLAEALVTALAGLLNDKQITELAEEYSDNVSYEGLEDGDEFEDGDKQEESGREAIMRRSAMLREFLAQVEKKVRQ